MGYLKLGGGVWGSSEPPEPLWMRHHVSDNIRLCHRVLLRLSACVYINPLILHSKHEQQRYSDDRYSGHPPVHPRSTNVWDQVDQKKHRCCEVNDHH